MNMNQEDNKKSFKILKEIDGYYGENSKEKKPKKQTQKNHSFKNYNVQDLLELEDD